MKCDQRAVCSTCQAHNATMLGSGCIMRINRYTLFIVAIFCCYIFDGFHTLWLPCRHASPYIEICSAIMSHTDVLFVPGFVCMVALPAACAGATLVLKQIDIYHAKMQSGHH